MLRNLHKMTRKEKVEKLIGNLQPLRHAMTLPVTKHVGMPKITPSQWGVLLLIEQFGGSTVNSVAKTLGITSSAATQLIDGLVANEYLERLTNPHDRRELTLTFSKKTKIRIDKMKKDVLLKFMNFFEVLNDQEFDQYILLNQKIIDRLLKNISSRR